MKKIEPTFPFVPHEIMNLGVMDLAAYRDECEKKVRQKIAAQFGPKYLALDWMDKAPGSQEERDQFYRQASGYHYDLVAYNADPGSLDRYNELVNAARGKTVLDFGGGIGTAVILLNLLGIRADYYDLRGVISDFAIWRFVCHGIECDSWLDNIAAIERKYDVISLIDVLEHIEEPVELLRSLKRFVNPGGFFYVFAPFAAVGEDHPMHLIQNADLAIDGLLDARLTRAGIERESERIWRVRWWEDE